MTDEQRARRNDVIIHVLAASAIPLAGAVVALLLWVVVPTIDTVNNLNSSMIKLVERVEGDARLNELRFRQAAARHDELEQRLAQHAVGIDRRVEKLEDGPRSIWGGPRGK